MAARVFFSYSHDDEQHRNQLEKHLALLRRQGLIETWHDRNIPAGGELDDQIDWEIDRADIILLLVSASFIASAYCYSREMARAMERHEAREARVVPVIVRDCDWHSAPFGKLKAVPTDGKPIVSWTNFDAAYTDVAKEIRRLVDLVGGTGGVVPGVAVQWQPVLESEKGKIREESSVLGPRSGNLRARREFSDRDKALFQKEAFEFMARYFENSLAELSARNDHIQGDFRRVDAQTFHAVLYRQGRQVSACAVHLEGGGALGSGIRYSSELGRGNSFNEQLTVAHDDQSLFLRSLGMATMSGRDESLTYEGGAELYWSILIRPVQ
jgi:hypothetical protein